MLKDGLKRPCRRVYTPARQRDATLCVVATVSECFEDEFLCDNDECIPSDWVCDGYDGCGDWSDELADCSELSVVSPVLQSKWLGSRVVSVLDSGAEGPGSKSEQRRCRATVLGKLFTPIVPFLSSSEIGSSPLKGCEGNCRPGGK